MIDTNMIEVELTGEETRRLVWELHGLSKAVDITLYPTVCELLSVLTQTLRPPSEIKPQDKMTYCEPQKADT